MKRPVQPPLFDAYPERPLGKIPASVQSGTNSDLIANIAPLYLTGSVLDVTYGRGGWWQRFTPDPFTFHDLALDGVDCRDLPEPTASIDTVCFDPPYIPQGGDNHMAKGDWGERFGLSKSLSQRDLDALLADGLEEALRVARYYVLAKCTDYANGDRLHLGHRTVIDIGERAGALVHDLIVHNTGSGPGGHNIFDAKRARRHHSYLIVFAVRRV